ncbi:MAG: BrnT family toxin [Nitrospiria bacterium]
MRFEWDEKKNEINIRKHGVDFADASEMFTAPMLVKPDRRKHYGETRYIGLGQIQGRIMVMVYTERKGDVCRIISLRKANRREQKTFEKTVKDKLGAP